MTERKIIHKEHKEQRYTPPLLLRGEQLRILPDNVKDTIASRVAKKVASNRHTMIQFEEDQVLAGINEGRAACMVDNTGQPVAFAQVWDIDGSGVPGAEGKYRDRRVTEVGSWLSFRPGFGPAILDAGARLAKERDPEALVIAISEKRNRKAIRMINQIGGKLLGEGDSAIVKDEYDNPAPVKVYDLADTDMNKQIEIFNARHQGR